MEKGVCMEKLQNQVDSTDIDAKPHPADNFLFDMAVIAEKKKLDVRQSRLKQRTHWRKKVRH